MCGGEQLAWSDSVLGVLKCVLQRAREAPEETWAVPGKNPTEYHAQQFYFENKLNCFWKSFEGMRQMLLTEQLSKQQSNDVSKPRKRPQNKKWQVLEKRWPETLRTR